MVHMNPMQLLKMKGMLDRFRKDHPKFVPFMENAAARIDEGTVIEISVTTRDGRQSCTNLRVNQADMEMIREIVHFSKET